MLPLQTHDLVDFFDCKGLRRTGELGHQQDAQTLGRLAADYQGQIDHGDHLPADIGHAHDRSRRVDHRGDFRHDQDFTHLEYVDAEQFAAVRVFRLAQPEQQQFEHAVACQIGPLVDIPHCC